MNTLLYDPKEHTEDKDAGSPYPHESHIADGGEFLDDGIRMHDQPLSETHTDQEDQTLADL